MKKFSIGLIVGVILGILGSLGYLFFNDSGKEGEQTVLKQKVETLQLEVDSLRTLKPKRIEIVKNLPPKERVIYIEKKLSEADSTRVDSISFLPGDTTQVIVSVEDLSRINGIIEERDILKEEVALLDSISMQKDSIITIQDAVITEQGKTIKRQKKILSIGGGAILGSALLLLILL